MIDTTRTLVATAATTLAATTAAHRAARAAATSACIQYGVSASRRRADLWPVCGRLTTDRRRYYVRIHSLTTRPPALARFVCTY